MAIKGAIYRGRTRTIEDALEAWKRDYQEAEKVKDIEAIIAEWLQSFEILREWQEESWAALQGGEIENVLEVGRMLSRGYELGAYSFSQVNSGVKWAEGRGYTVDGAEDLRRSFRRLQGLAKELAEKWPSVNKGKIEEALASLDHDEGIEIGGWLRELQGEDVVASEA
jgi:hypothetical protein